jgi:hypothetical protein
MVEDLLTDFTGKNVRNWQKRNKRENDRKKRENDPGFWGTFMRSVEEGSTIIHLAEQGGKWAWNKIPHGEDFSKYAEEGYDWREVAAKYAPQVPEEVFQGSRSSKETDARLREYEKEMFSRWAMEDRPFTSFLGRCFGFGADLWVMQFIPLIGGLAIKAGTAAGRKVTNSVLKRVVTNGVSFALDMGEVGALRAVADDRVTFGKAVGEIPKEMMVGALLGGAFGTLEGAWAARKKPSGGNKPFHGNPLAVRVGEQVEEGAKIPDSPAVGNDTYHTPEEYVAIVSQQMKAMDDRMAAHGIALGQEDSKNFIEVVGGIGEKSATEKPSAMSLSLLAVDPKTRAFGSQSGTVSGLARLLHDSHLPSLGDGDGELPLDVAVRTKTNAHRGAVAKVVEDTYQKVSKDRSVPPITRDEINRLLGQTHLNGGVVPDGLPPQLSSIIGESYGRLKASFFEPLEEMFLDLQIMTYGPALLERSKNFVEKGETTVNTMREAYGKHLASRDDMVAREVDRELAHP